MTVPALARRVRMLTVYAVLVSLGLVVVLLTGAASERRASFTEIDVERINVRKPDGRLSMVVSSEARMPGVIVGDREVSPPKGRSGLLFYDGEGVEMGGLTYGSTREGETVSHGAHLAFDGRGRDQALELRYAETWEGDTRTERLGGLRLVDRHGPAGAERYAMVAKRHSDDPADRAEAEAWFAEHARYGEDWANRVVIGSIDGRAYVGLNDPQARERIRLTVGPDGAPRVDVLDAEGGVVRSLGLDG